MRTKYRLLRLAAWLVLVLGPAGLGAQESKRPAQVDKDLAYGKAGDTDLKLALGLPKAGDGPFPALVCIHPGSWRQGNRQQLSQTIETLAGRGYVAVTVSYRLVPTATF